MKHLWRDQRIRHPLLRNKLPQTRRPERLRVFTSGCCESGPWTRAVQPGFLTPGLPPGHTASCRPHSRLTRQGPASELAVWLLEGCRPAGGCLGIYITCPGVPHRAAPTWWLVTAPMEQEGMRSPGGVVTAGGRPITLAMSWSL